MYIKSYYKSSGGYTGCTASELSSARNVGVFGRLAVMTVAVANMQIMRWPVGAMCKIKRL